MRAGIERQLRLLLRVLVLWAVDAVALAVAALVVPGIALSAAHGFPAWLVALAAALLLGLVNLLVRPIVLLIARPLGFTPVFLLAFLLNGLSLWLTAALLPGFRVAGVLPAFLGGLVFAVVNTVLTGILEIDEHGSYYQSVIVRQAARRRPPAAGGEAAPGASGVSRPAWAERGSEVVTAGTGLVMLEVDGLSYHHMRKALEEGRMPTLQRMMEEEGYRLSRIDCGLPSQTSSCQAGIMFGDNYDIPAFRWFDKDEQKLYVSSRDAPAINRRFARGRGLMRGGTSIGNMLNGDAADSLLTLADIQTDEAEERRQRAEDVSLLALDPYFLMRTLVLAIGEALREIWQAWRQRWRREHPRLNRLAGLYPLVRAASCVFLRDMAANLAVLHIARGSPAIYVLWPGYDDVAHHSGPWSEDAFGELERWDQVVAKIGRAIHDFSVRPYQIIVLSDHGQSYGATFKQRYGMTLGQLIRQHLPAGTSLSQALGGDDASASLQGLSGELGNLEHEGRGRVGRAVAAGGQRLAERGVREREALRGQAKAEVMALGSGNLAHVYFDLASRRLSLEELNRAYPGMVDAVVGHEGIGFVAGYQNDGAPVVLGKKGKRNLHTGEVTGEDPLLPYATEHGRGDSPGGTPAPDGTLAFGGRLPRGDSPRRGGRPAPDGRGRSGVGEALPAELEKRVWQVRRVMDFPHSGDLVINSTAYPDGTVAALEEQIGSHGGLGGEQTDAFLFHPPGLEAPPTRNSCDVYAILNGYRERVARGFGRS